MMRGLATAAAHHPWRAIGGWIAALLVPLVLIVFLGDALTGEAALIIIAVFGGFAVGDLVMFQQMGFGVAVSLLIDATLIRSVLLPAAMKLLGDWNWYLPSRLQWLPDFRVEGGK